MADIEDLRKEILAMQINKKEIQMKLTTAIKDVEKLKLKIST